MIGLILFAIIALLEIFSAIMILKSKHILHSVIFLSFIFLLNAIIFAMLNQPLLAIIQLFIMIGGISVFMFVGVATEGKMHALNNMPAFFVLWIVLSALMLVVVYPELGELSQAQAQPSLSSSSIAVSLGFQPFSFLLIFTIIFLIAAASALILSKLRGS